VPEPYRDLGLRPEQLTDHIGWDIGAALVTEALAEYFAAPAILSQASRLVIDCNRDLGDHDLIVPISDGVRVPGNAEIGADETARRVREIYAPFHRTIDAILQQQRPSLLLSVHSFTPTMNGRSRDFDIGVLFDLYADEATALGKALSAEGFRVRYNEPYSGLDGLIYSAKRHGTRHGVRYLELEINNGLLREEGPARALAHRIASALAPLLQP